MATTSSTSGIGSNEQDVNKSAGVAFDDIVSGVMIATKYYH